MVVLLTASLTALLIGGSDLPVVGKARNVAATVVRPADQAIDAAARPFRNAWHGITDHDEVRRENERLRAELDEVDSAAIRQSDAEKQLADLSRVLDMPWVGDVPTVTVRVVSGPVSNFSHAVEIDKGTGDGIDEGMPVATGAGLVGRVSRADSTSATVELLTDPDFRVGVRLAETGALGTARGRGRTDPLLVDTALGPRTKVEEGAGVVTSGIDRSAFPAGIPVGRVADTRDAAGGLALELLVDPLVDVDQLSYLTVLRWQQPG